MVRNNSTCMAAAAGGYLKCLIYRYAHEIMAASNGTMTLWALCRPRTERTGTGLEFFAAIGTAVGTGVP
jgi:hypothetical protein